MNIFAIAVALSACTLCACGQDKPASTQAPATAPTTASPAPAPPPAGDSYMPGADIGAAPPETTRKDDAKK